jgi:hypothetical protein
MNVSIRDAVEKTETFARLFIMCGSLVLPPNHHAGHRTIKNIPYTSAYGIRHVAIAVCIPLNPIAPPSRPHRRRALPAWAKTASVPRAVWRKWPAHFPLASVTRSNAVIGGPRRTRATRAFRIALGFRSHDVQLKNAIRYHSFHRGLLRQRGRLGGWVS